MMGPPGTGKSAIADGVAKAIAAPVFSADPIEGVLIRNGITREQRSDRIAYDLAADLARAQLALGQSAVIDAVNAFEFVRQQWRDMAAEYRTPLVLVECVCSDEALHRRRIEERRRQIPGFVYEPSWADVAAREYEPCADARLVLDAVRPIEENIARAVAYVRSCGAGR